MQGYIVIAQHKTFSRKTKQMTNNKQCPCKQCILMVKCKHKDYLDLFKQCTLITKYIPDHRFRYLRDMKRIIELTNTLVPTKWFTDGTEVMQPMIRSINDTV